MKIALAGFGTEGKANYDYWNRDGNQLTLVSEGDSIDGVPHGVAQITGPDAFSKLSDFDLIIRSPGVNPSKLPYGDKVWSATNEFFEKCPAMIIGVTGTKGKGTTSSLIASILRAAGKTVHLVGNIGKPAISELADMHSGDIVVYELSSFQLWDAIDSPHIAVILGIEADHLDVHADFDDYIAAKANITRYQKATDKLVYNKNNMISTHIAKNSVATCVAYPDNSIMVEYGSELVIPGQHNVENAAAAIEAVSEYVIEPNIIKAGLASFTGLPHRIKLVREHNGASYYDDSYSSAPAASIAALRSFTGRRIIIVGGYEKHANFTDLAHFIAQDETIHAVLIGQTRNRIARDFADAGVDQSRYEVIDGTDFPEIIRHISKNAVEGDVVLLSPGCASFDMFQNFTDRGEQFINIVNEL